MDNIEKATRVIKARKLRHIDDIIEVLRKYNVLYSEYQKYETIKKHKRGIL